MATFPIVERLDIVEPVCLRCGLRTVAGVMHPLTRQPVEEALLSGSRGVIPHSLEDEIAGEAHVWVPAFAGTTAAMADGITTSEANH